MKLQAGRLQAGKMALKCDTCCTDMGPGVAFHPCGEGFYSHVGATVCIEEGEIVEVGSCYKVRQHGRVPMRRYKTTSCELCVLLRRGFLKRATRHVLNKKMAAPPKFSTFTTSPRKVRVDDRQGAGLGSGGTPSHRKARIDNGQGAGRGSGGGSLRLKTRIGDGQGAGSARKL